MNIINICILFIVSLFVLVAHAQDEQIQALPKNLQHHVKELTGTPEPRTHANIQSLNSARDYIVRSFKGAGLRVRLQEYEVAGKIYANVVSHIDVGAKKTIIVGAHYDVCGDQAGADDNASGVAGLLELARILQENRDRLRCNIEFIAYVLEEPPYFRTKFMGSYIHAQSVKEKKQDIEYMLCLEMIGYFTDVKDSQEYPSPLMKRIYPTTGNFIAVVGNLESAAPVTAIKKSILANADIPCEGLVAPSELPGVDFSDHFNYWDLGIKAVMITDTSFYRNKNYHKKTDTPDTLNYQKMSEVVKGLLPTFYKK